MLAYPELRHPANYPSDVLAVGHFQALCKLVSQQSGW